MPVKQTRKHISREGIPSTALVSREPIAIQADSISSAPKRQSTSASAPPTLPATLRRLTNVTHRIVSFAPVQAAICVLCVLLSAFCAIDGGYQLHLSHDHAALSCLDSNIATSAGDQIDLGALRAAPRPCTTPDESGQPWRLKLVLRDMLGFLVFGMFCFQKTKQSFFASEPSA